MTRCCGGVAQLTTLKQGEGSAGAASAQLAGTHCSMGDPLDASKIVKLNVGGVRYATSIATLTAVECSFFDVLFSGRWQQHVTDENEVFLDRDGEVFKYVLAYLRARTTCSETVYLPLDEPSRALLAAEARYYMLPGLEALLLESPASTGSFTDLYRQQSSALDSYIAQQPFQQIKNVLFDILLGQRQLRSAWNPALEHGQIMVSLMNAPVVRMSFTVSVGSDHVRLTDGINRFKVVLPDQLLESVFSGYYEIYLFEFVNPEEAANFNKCIYNLGSRAVLLRMLQEQQMFDVRMAYDKRERSHGSDFELLLEFHRRPWPSPLSPRMSTGLSS